MHARALVHVVSASAARQPRTGSGAAAGCGRAGGRAQLADGDLALFGDQVSAHADDPVVRSLHHLASTPSRVAQPPATAAEPRHRA